MAIGKQALGGSEDPKKSPLEKRLASVFLSCLALTPKEKGRYGVPALVLLDLPFINFLTKGSSMTVTIQKTADCVTVKVHLHHSIVLMIFGAFFSMMPVMV